MTKFLISAAATALTIAAMPASAQVLGGGGLGGSLGGQLGGTLGGSVPNTSMLPGRTNLPDPIDTATRSTSRTRVDSKSKRHVDTRNGKVSASQAVDGSLDSTLDSTTEVAGRNLGASTTGSASGSASGNADSQLVGTDAARSTARQATSDTRTQIQNARGRTTNLIGTARNSAGNKVNGAGDASGGASGSANGMVSGSLGQLALAGSGAAGGAGSFAVSPGMTVTDARGRAIGTVQSVRSTARGTVQSVRMKVGKQIADIPAANFTGQGNVLVSAMGKSQAKETAKNQR